MKSNLVRIVCLSCLSAVAACRGPNAETGPESTPSNSPTSQPSKSGNATNAIANLAVGKSVTGVEPNSQYPAKGLRSLVDGVMGGEDYFDEAWMGWWYEDKPFEATIDLGKIVAIDELGVNVLATSEAWIFYPRKVEFEISRDGKTFEKVATLRPTEEDFKTEEPETKMMSQADLQKEGRYVRVRIERFGPLPEWHAAHGGGDGYDGEAWLFIDEIVVNPK